MCAYIFLPRILEYDTSLYLDVRRLKARNTPKI